MAVTPDICYFVFTSSPRHMGSACLQSWVRFVRSFSVLVLFTRPGRRLQWEMNERKKTSSNEAKIEKKERPCINYRGWPTMSALSCTARRERFDPKQQACSVISPCRIYVSHICISIHTSTYRRGPSTIKGGRKGPSGPRKARLQLAFCSQRGRSRAEQAKKRQEQAERGKSSQETGRQACR